MTGVELEDGFGRPTVAEIDLRALRANYRALSAYANGAKIMAVVKADAYGHGAAEVARSLRDEGCRHFAIATVEEAAGLRAAGVAERIYLLGGFFADQSERIVELDVTAPLFDPAVIDPLDRAAERLGRRDFPVHLKLDTGATRLGILPDDLDQVIDALRRARTLKLEGAFTLLATAADPASLVTDRQLSVFNQAIARLRSAGFELPRNHVANSAAIVLRPDSHFDLMRPGLSLYGLPPVHAMREKIELRPVMTFKTRLMQVKRVAAGCGVSYGHTYVTPRESSIGVLAVGYADGYRRGLQFGGEVMIRGRRAPVVGAVCMDLTMVDVTDVPEVRIGDEVILWGGAGEAMISVNDVARLAQTISYEMLCTVGRRVPRIYRNE
ncbi:MAG TPA: alanine racemase [Candidatus Binataceae bacterium]|nr:alanine racemase [Candidatus Binataceae bacterium]